MGLTNKVIRIITIDSLYGSPLYYTYNGVAEKSFLNDEKPVLPPGKFIDYINSPPEYITFNGIEGMCCNIQ